MTANPNAQPHHQELIVIQTDPIPTVRDRITEARDRLCGMALDLATGSAVVEPSSFNAGIDEFCAAVLREAADIAESLRQFEPAFGARKSAQISENVGILRVADELRRRADRVGTASPRPEPRIPDHVVNEEQGPDDEETFCSWGEGDAPGSGCILRAGHEPANRHLYTPGDADEVGA